MIVRVSLAAFFGDSAVSATLLTSKSYGKIFTARDLLTAALARSGLDALTMGSMYLSSGHPTLIRVNASYSI